MNVGPEKPPFLSRRPYFQDLRPADFLALLLTVFTAACSWPLIRFFSAVCRGRMWAEITLTPSFSSDVINIKYEEDILTS
jgi:hypothetical protein